MQYNLSTPAAITEAAKEAKTRANMEPSQGSYNAAWLHGYASALADVARQMEQNTKETAVAIVELFEDLLERHGLTIPDDDRPADNDTPIYGVTYGDLVDKIEAILQEG